MDLLFTEFLKTLTQEKKKKIMRRKRNQRRDVILYKYANDKRGIIKGSHDKAFEIKQGRYLNTVDTRQHGAHWELPGIDYENMINFRYKQASFWDMSQFGKISNDNYDEIKAISKRIIYVFGTKEWEKALHGIIDFTQHGILTTTTDIIVMVLWMAFSWWYGGLYEINNMACFRQHIKALTHRDNWNRKCNNNCWKSDADIWYQWVC